MLTALVLGLVATACPGPVDESAFVSFNEPAGWRDGDTYVMRSQDFVLTGRVLSRDSALVEPEPGFDGASCCVRIEVQADRAVFRNPDGMSRTDQVFGFTTENSRAGCTDAAYSAREDVCFVPFATTAVQLPVEVPVTFTVTAYEGRAVNAGFAVQEMTVRLDPDVVVVPINHVYATTSVVSDSTREIDRRRIVTWIDGHPGEVERIERTGQNTVSRTLHWTRASGLDEVVDRDPIGFPNSEAFPDVRDTEIRSLGVQFQLGSLEFAVDDYVGRYVFGPDQNQSCSLSNEPFRFLTADSPVVAGDRARRDLGGVLVIETTDASTLHGPFANVSCGPASSCSVGRQNFIALNRFDRPSLGHELVHAIGLDHSTSRCGAGLYTNATTAEEARAALSEYVRGIVCDLGRSAPEGRAGYPLPSRCP